MIIFPMNDHRIANTGFFYPIISDLIRITIIIINKLTRGKLCWNFNCKINQIEQCAVASCSECTNAMFSFYLLSFTCYKELTLTLHTH